MLVVKKCHVGYYAQYVSTLFTAVKRCRIQSTIVLQGYMYLTNSYLCFFAHMPSREVCSFSQINHCKPLTPFTGPSPEIRFTQQEGAAH